METIHNSNVENIIEYFKHLESSSFSLENASDKIKYKDMLYFDYYWLNFLAKSRGNKNLNIAARKAKQLDFIKSSIDYRYIVGDKEIFNLAKEIFTSKEISVNDKNFISKLIFQHLYTNLSVVHRKQLYEELSSIIIEGRNYYN